MKDRIVEGIRDFFVDNSPGVIKFLIVLVVGYLAIRLLTYIFGKSKVMKKLDPTIFALISGLVRFFLYVAYLIIILSLLGIPMTTFIAMLSALGLAIALALQGNLSNFASTLMLLTFKPFKVGDFIESQNNIGTVKDIQLLFTHILTPENKKIIIPNSELINSRITNYTSEENRRIDFVFSASYDDDVEEVKDIIMEIVDKHPLILKEPLPVVRLSGHALNSLDYDVKVWGHKDNFWSIKYDMYEQVRAEFLKRNITIPYSQHTLWMNER